MKSRNRNLSERTRIDRRAAIGWMAAAAAALASSPLGGRALASQPPPRSTLGLVAYCCSHRRQAMRASDPDFDLFEPLTFLRHCHDVGAAGMQASLGVLDAVSVRTLRDFADEHNLFIDGIVNPPRDDGDLLRFEAEIRTAGDAGALAVRTVVMPGRRYEQFKSLAEVRQAEANAVKMLELAAPIVTKHRVRLAVENHKDQRIDERLALYQRLSSEYIGACVDTGNSFALLDDPYETIEALAPYAFTVHLKDQTLSEYADGFLLGDIPLGQGGFDLKRMLAILKRAKPDIRMQLELITRDPLKVPCLTDRYWSTLPDVSGADLARTLRFVRQHQTGNDPQVSSLSPDKQVELEDANIAASLKYASEELGL